MMPYRELGIKGEGQGLACLLSNLGGFPGRTPGCEEKVDPGESGSGFLTS